MWLLFPFFLLTGLFLPGYFVARCLNGGLCGAAAFVISLLILFQSVFWLGLFDTEITLWTVLPCLALATLGAGWLERRSSVPTKKPAKTKSRPRAAKINRRKAASSSEWRDRILVLSSVIVGIVLLTTSAVSPLVADTTFRWDFLARRLLALGKFDFYPPLTPTQFHDYFYVDAIPPLVSFARWWIYAAAGQYLPSLISVFVAAQFACTLVFTYGTASVLFSRRAGFLAAAILAASPLYFKSVVLGQETGLTALSIAAMIYFISSARQPNDIQAVILAGLAAALCALSREYGWIAVIAGIIALLWKRERLRQIAVFAVVATAVALPWYTRNWIRTGNPFYSLRLASFAVNPIHSAILHYYHTLLGAQNWSTNNWTTALFSLLMWAPIQFLAGIWAGFLRFRQHGYLLVIALLTVAVWLQSTGYTSGGVGISMRVLSPALVVLSVLGAGVMEPLTRRAHLYAATMITIVLCQAWTAAYGVFYPNEPYAVPVAHWRENAFRPVLPPTEFQLRDELLQKVLVPGSRVLSDNAYLHAALIDKGVEVVPVWSPEVSFLFSAPPEEVDNRLRSLGITSVAYYPKSFNTGYLVSASPFYASLPQRWHFRGELPGFFNLYTPPNR